MREILKRFWIPAVFVAVTVAVLMIVLTGGVSSSQFQQYKRYAATVHVQNWRISQSTAEEFADSNCDTIESGRIIGIKFINDDHLKSTAAVVKAYCPDGLNSFLAGVMIDQPQYTNTAILISKELNNE